MFSRPHASTAQPSRPTTAAYSSLKPCTPGAWLGEACGLLSSDCVHGVQIFWRAQPVTQPENASFFSIGGTVEQTEIFIPFELRKARWVDPAVVQSWSRWRDAVLWCWQNRVNGTGNDDGDQAMFRMFCLRYFKTRVHAPHVSRWFNPKTKAPMDMPTDLVAAFEAYTGWRGTTQRFNRAAHTTCMEEVQARFAA